MQPTLTVKTDKPIISATVTYAGGYYQPECVYLLPECAFSIIDKQEPLGERFEKVLYENLWDLYEE